MILVPSCARRGPTIRGPSPASLRSGVPQAGASQPPPPPPNPNQRGGMTKLILLESVTQESPTGLLDPRGSGRADLVMIGRRNVKSGFGASKNKSRKAENVRVRMPASHDK
ncbi:hypothetical protein B0H19DRAFT_1069695 [Mycena capillaripes]|nr:hypothetical protein B0H19DRAFT_1069695 [Mycena capillaripes]